MRRGKPVEVEAFRRDMTAQVNALATSAAAVVAAFREQVDAGSLRPPQHATLLLLEQSLQPFADACGLLPGGDVGGLPPAQGTARPAANGGVSHSAPLAGPAARDSDRPAA